MSRTFSQLRQIVSELGYAQRRLFEIRTGISADGPHRGPSTSR